MFKLTRGQAAREDRHLGREVRAVQVVARVWLLA